MIIKDKGTKGVKGNWYQGMSWPIARHLQPDTNGPIAAGGQQRVGTPPAQGNDGWSAVRRDTAC